MRRLVLAFACIAALPAASQIMKWTDAEGRVHYGDRPPPDVKAQDTKISNIPYEAPLAQVRVLHPQIEPFAVEGVTRERLRETMRATAPRDKDGKPRWGQARWELDWRFGHERRDGCRIGTYTITVSSTLRMPEWRDRARAPAPLQASWDDFYRALLRHENGHVDNGIRAANDLARRLRALEAYPDCAALNEAISALGKRIISEYRMVDQAYDRGTDHGVTQGAVLR